MRPEQEIDEEQLEDMVDILSCEDIENIMPDINFSYCPFCGAKSVDSVIIHKPLESDLH